MKRLLKNFLTALSLSAALTGSTIAGAADKDIVDTAVAAGSFKTLAAALQAADLVDTLKGEGPFTVFAPTDEAFSKLPPGTVESLLKPENKKQLAAVLAYHVVAGKVAAKQVVGLKGARTLNGQRVDIFVSGGSVAVDKANVVKTDIECSNGIIHVIDSVLLPPAEKKVSSVEASQMILGAIAQGAPTYNAGHHQACAQLYMTTASSLVNNYGDLPPQVVANLKYVITQAQHSTCPTDQAWALRKGLDQAYVSMNSTR